MTFSELFNFLPRPVLPSERVRQQAEARQARLTKPNGALGRLEQLACQLAAFTERLAWLPMRRAVIICAADHGVARQGVSAYPQAVTAQMVLNFLRGGAAVNVLARQMDARMLVVDAGVAAALPEHPMLLSGKIAHGTADLSVGAAMSEVQAAESLRLGICAFERMYTESVDIVAVGEMGIANTTAASAIIAALTGASPAEVTGRGTGIDDARLRHKIEVIERALQVNQPRGRDTLAKVGGFEIGAMAGAMLAAAAARVPILLDGLISTAAALIAAEFAPEVRHALIAGHRSAERGHQIALDHLGLSPLLDLDMRLGEGTGALLALPLVEAAMRTLQEMATFDEAGVSEKEPSC
jgi:nicotinate-nucleotide--dimethylbenzimidazole phosphoribosyltransferase